MRHVLRLTDWLALWALAALCLWAALDAIAWRWSTSYGKADERTR